MSMLMEAMHLNAEMHSKDAVGERRQWENGDVALAFGVWHQIGEFHRGKAAKGYLKALQHHGKVSSTQPVGVLY